MVQGGVLVVVVGKFVSQLRSSVNPQLNYVYIGDWVALLFVKLQFDGFVISRICNFTIEFLANYSICDDVDLLFRYFFIWWRLIYCLHIITITTSYKKHINLYFYF